MSPHIHRKRWEAPSWQHRHHISARQRGRLPRKLKNERAGRAVVYFMKAQILEHKACILMKESASMNKLLWAVTERLATGTIPPRRSDGSARPAPACLWATLHPGVCSVSREGWLQEGWKAAETFLLNEDASVLIALNINRGLSWNVLMCCSEMSRHRSNTDTVLCAWGPRDAATRSALLPSPPQSTICFPKHGGGSRERRHCSYSCRSWTLKGLSCKPCGDQHLPAALGWNSSPTLARGLTLGVFKHGQFFLFSPVMAQVMASCHPRGFKASEPQGQFLRG